MLWLLKIFSALLSLGTAAPDIYTYEQIIPLLATGEPHILEIAALEGKGAPVDLEVYLDGVRYCPDL